MLVIGLTGSIAMGKSEAARYLASLGLPIFDSDAEVHKLYEGEQGAQLIRPYVPEATVNGKVDRKTVSDAVLKDPALLLALEKNVHAEIRQRRQHFIAQAEMTGAKAAILDIPLLYETGAEKDVDKVIVISAPPEIQRLRALARPGMTESRLAMILAKQLPDVDKRARADAVIDNNSTLQQMQNNLHILAVKWGLISNA